MAGQVNPSKKISGPRAPAGPQARGWDRTRAPAPEAGAGALPPGLGGLCGYGNTGLDWPRKYPKKQGNRIFGAKLH